MLLKQRLKVKGRKILFQFPELYYARYKMRGGRDKLVTNKKKDIVIEGPPRTANTFMVEAFVHAQKKEVKVAHHMHVPGQLTRAVKLGIPAIVLIRNPRDTAISHAIAGMNKDEDSLEIALHYYIDFYETLKPYRDYFVLARFDDIINNPAKIINTVNKKFNVNFDNYSESFPFDEKALWDRIDQMYKNWGKDQGLKWFGQGEIDEHKVSRPSENRKELKNKLLKAAETERFEVLFKRANSIYQYFIQE